MNKTPLWLIVATALLFCVTASGAKVLLPVKVGPNEYPDLSYPVAGPVFKLPQIWKYKNDDSKDYAGEHFDDSNWENIKVGQSKPGGSWRWYRTDFDLPASLKDRNLLLDLGRVSVYDEVFVNGVQVGHFGNPPPHFLHGASDVWRKYPIAAEHFHPGRNVLAIRVFIGHKGGLYQGPYTLQALSGEGIVGKINLKTGGSNALETLLTESSHLNTFGPGERLLIGPDLLSLFGSSGKGEFTAKIVDGNNKILAQDAIVNSLNRME